VRRLPLKLVLGLIIPLSWAINPIQEWQKPPPVQQLVTKSSPAPQSKPEQVPTTEIHYEDIVVFSLKAVVAAFHFDPPSFISDRKHLDTYFDDNALNQVEQALLPGSGSGLLDHCLLKLTPCDAIANGPLMIESAKPHVYQVRLPMITSTKQALDVILLINPKPYFRVTDFSIEIHDDKE